MSGFAFCGGANGTVLEDARTFYTATGSEIDPIALSGIGRVDLAVVGRAYYSGEATCAELLRSDADAARLSHAFIAESGLGLVYEFSSGATESCGAQPAIVPWEEVARHGEPQGALRDIAHRATAGQR